MNSHVLERISVCFQQAKDPIDFLSGPLPVAGTAEFGWPRWKVGEGSLSLRRGIPSTSEAHSRKRSL